MLIFRKILRTYYIELIFRTYTYIIIYLYLELCKGILKTEWSYLLYILALPCPTTAHGYSQTHRTHLSDVC